MLFLIAINVTASYFAPATTAHSAEVSVGLAFTNARVAPLWIADFEDVVDASIIQKFDKSGYIDSLYK